MLPKFLVVLVVLCVGVVAVCPPVVACNTPVYRYAMYNWQTAPYIVFYFYEGEVPEADKAIHETLEGLTEKYPPEANVQLEKFDVSDEKKMGKLPEFVIEAWKEYEGGKTPAYVVYSPFRAHIYSGELDAESVKKLVDSPARQKFGQLLEEGNAAVMILLTCPDEEQNKKAEEALAELRRMADGGEIPVELELPPMGLPGQEEGGESDDDVPDPNKLGIAVLKVDRKDPAEEFFVRMLMGVEDDLREYVDQPMIFAGYGRGRAMEPYIGKGITAENLVDVVAFLAGACSCLVKEQNPGADLLVKWNWDATADKMAANDPSLDYGPYGPQGYGEYAAEPAMSGDDVSEEPKGGDDVGEVTTKVAGETQADSGEAEGEASPVEVAIADPVVETEEAGGAEDSEIVVVDVESATQEARSYAGRRMFTYAVGFGAIAVGVVLAGLALMMRRS